MITSKADKYKSFSYFSQPGFINVPERVSCPDGANFTRYNLQKNK